MSGVLKLKSAAAVKAKVADTPAVKPMRTVRVKVEYEAAVARRAKRAKRSVHDTCVTHRWLHRKFFQCFGRRRQALENRDRERPVRSVWRPRRGDSKHQRYWRACICAAQREHITCMPYLAAKVVDATRVDLNGQAASEVTAEGVQPKETVQ